MWSSCRAWVVACCCLFIALPALALPTLEEVTTRIAETERRPATDAARDPLLQVLQQTKGFIEAQQTNIEQADKYAKTLSTGPASIKQLAGELSRLVATADAPLITGDETRLSLAELQQVLEAAVTERAALESKLNGYELRDRALQSRPAEIVQDKNRLSARIGEIELEMSSLGADDGSEQARARLAMFEAEIAARQSELDALNQEQLSHGIRLETNSARRRLADARLTRATARVGALEQLLLDKRQTELRRIVDDATKAQRDTQGAHPLVRKLAEDNTALSQSLSQVLDDQARVVRERAQYSERRQRLNEEFERARQRAAIAGASSSLGRILVDQRRQIPEIRSLRRLAKLNETQVSKVGLARIEIDEKLRATVDVGDKLAALNARLDPPGAPLNPEETAQAQLLFDDQTRLLNTLDENYASYLRMLDAADFELQQMTNTVAAYRAFLDERLLWLPNAPPLSLAFFGDVVSATQWFLSPPNWYQTVRDAQNGARRAWPRLLVVVLVIAALLRAVPRLRAYLITQAALVGHPTDDRLRNTLSALVVTCLLALPWPLALWLVADLLTAGYAGAEFTIALGQLSAKAAQLLFALLWVRVFLSRYGVALRHLMWPTEAVERTRRQWLRWGQLFVPAYAIATAFEWSSNPAFQYSLRRGFFLIAMGSVAAFIFWLTKRAGVLHHQMALNHPTTWLTRSRPVWALVAAGAPGVLAALSVFGYHYTALELSGYYLETLLLILAAAILYHLALRWLLVAQRRIAAKAAIAEQAEVDPDSPVAEQELTPDLTVMNTQARLIIRNVAGWTAALALFWVWRDVLPALTVFEKVTLWQIEVKDVAGAIQQAPITIANAAVAVVMILITMIAARNMPGILEIALLQRLGIHRGSRYAVTTLVQYFIVALGVTLALSTLGLRWSQVQWLIAALGVGLGFGLQEIFANFISGLILLFERPIRVGDVVTIGDLTGRVSRIQIRATTISDADNREIIVPNKNFITERFINWTLTDQVTRIVINIGVAYGSDIEQVSALLMEIARSHPKVLKDPEPAVAFSNFGDSALTFELQVHARELLDRRDLRHDLNSAIYRTLMQHGIEIPFPQRDVHLRSVPPGMEMAAPGPGGPAAA
jgi:potassium efflux system protein